MTFAYVTLVLSPHQLPLCAALADLLPQGDFRCFIVQDLGDERKKLGWNDDVPDWVLLPTTDPTELASRRKWLLEADVLLTSNRDMALLKERVLNSKLTIYTSERWFKPPIGLFRLLHPRLFHSVRQMRRLSKFENFFYLPMGRWACRDMKRIACFDQRCRQWGYFVASSEFNRPEAEGSQSPRRVLWVGRMLALKRIDTLIRAVGILRREGYDLLLTLVGYGPEEIRLKKMAKRVNDAGRAGQGSVNEDAIVFSPPVAIDEVRQLMREYEIYVFPSNGCEGWGAVVNEAMAEGCCVIAARETGAATLLVKDGVTGLSFSSGSVDELVQCLRKVCTDDDLRSSLSQNGQAFMQNYWAPDAAANRLVSACYEWLTTGAFPVFSEGPLALFEEETAQYIISS